MKKIWLWNHDATCMFFNQGGRHYWFAKYLKDKNFDPIIFCSNINHFNGAEVKISHKYKVDTVSNIPFVFIKTSPYRGNGIKRIINWISFYIGLFACYKKIIRNYGSPDLILASSVHPLTMVAGIQIARRLGIPCICEIRDLWPEAIFQVKRANENSILGRMLVAGEHWIYRNADALIFTKEGDTDYLKEKGWLYEQGGDIDIRKCNYINNGVDLDQYIAQICKYTLDDEDLNNNKFKIVYTGTIREVNNLSTVVDCANLLKEHEDIQFILYGTGDYQHALEKKARELKLKNLIFKGYVNKRYIPYILSKSSLNLLNYSQGLYNWSRGNSSNKLFEYMASGKPILSTVKMGYSPLDKYHCGVSLENNTPKDMAVKILEIKNFPESVRNEMGKNARAGVADFDFKNLTEKLISVINQVLYV